MGSLRSIEEENSWNVGKIPRNDIDRTFLPLHSYSFIKINLTAKESKVLFNSILSRLGAENALH